MLLACRVFQSRRLRLQFVKAGERGVEICLVEDFAAGYPVAFDGQGVDRPPLGVEAFRRAPRRRMGDDRSEIVEPMHRLDVDLQVWREIPNGAKDLGHGAGLERASAPAIDGGPVCRGKFVPVERGVCLCNHGPGLRVGGGLTGDVSGVELFDGSVDVVSDRTGPAAVSTVVGVDFDDADHLSGEFTGSPSHGTEDTRRE